MSQPHLGQHMEQVTALNYAGDFRGGAALVSIRFCEDRRISSVSRDLIQLGVSLCLPASDNPEAEMHAIRRSVVTMHLIMVGLLLAGVTMLIVAVRGAFVTQFGLIRIPIWAGAIPALAGWVMMCSCVNTEHWIIRRRIASRGADNAPFSVDASPLMFRLEDPATYRLIKLVIDDVAIGWCDYSRRVLQLEGFGYRYVIWAKDILSLNRLGDRFVEVKFYVGGSNQVLALAFAMNGVAIELRRLLSFGMAKRAVEGPLSSVFALPVPWPAADFKA